MESLPRFQDTDFWLDIENVIIGPEIGKGQFSTVYAGKYFGDIVAVKKQIRKEVTLEAYILRELAVLKIASHENLVQYIGAYNEENYDEDGLSASYIVTELCLGGDLLRLLLNKEEELSWKLRTKIAMQAAGAINFLHQKNLIHRDIKSSNILLDEHWNCKITDFGMARLINTAEHNIEDEEDGRGRKMTICGTEDYMAPEMLFDEEYSFSVDIFCFGMVLCEIMARAQVGKNNFLVRKPKDKFMIDVDALRERVMSPVTQLNNSSCSNNSNNSNNNRNSFTLSDASAVPPESLFTLAIQCTDYDPSLRPDAEQTLDWLQDLYDADDPAVSLIHAVQPRRKSSAPSLPPSAGVSFLDEITSVRAPFSSAPSIISPTTTSSSQPVTASAALTRRSTAAAAPVQRLYHSHSIYTAVVQLTAQVEAAEQQQHATPASMMVPEVEVAVAVAAAASSAGMRRSTVTFLTPTNSQQVPLQKLLSQPSTQQPAATATTSAITTHSRHTGLTYQPSTSSTTSTSTGSTTSSNTTNNRVSFSYPSGLMSLFSTMSSSSSSSNATSPPLQNTTSISGIFPPPSAPPSRSNSIAAASRGSISNNLAAAWASSKGTATSVMLETLPLPPLQTFEEDLYDRFGLQEGGITTAAACGGGANHYHGGVGDDMSDHDEHHHQQQQHRPHHTTVLRNDYHSNVEDDDNAAVLKTGYLFKRNETGFRNWKKILFTLTETKLMWKSQSDPTKLSYFLLRNTTIKRTRQQHRFQLTQTNFGPTTSNSNSSNLPDSATAASASAQQPLGCRSPSPAPPMPHQHSIRSPSPSNFSTTLSPGTAAAAASGHHHPPQHLTFFQKELAAASAVEMEEWVRAIQEAIDDENVDRCLFTAMPVHSDNGTILDDYGSNSNTTLSTSSSTLTTTGRGIEEFDSVGSWLDAVGLPDDFARQYEELFQAKGYGGSTALIAKVGLQQEDLQHIGITHPAHCRLLLSSVHAHYAESLRLSICGYNKVDTCVVFKIVSRWQYNRSSLYLKVAHFKKFDKAIRKDLKLGGSLFEYILSTLPSLPCEVTGKMDSQKGRVDDILGFYAILRQKLEIYLLSVAAVLVDTPKLYLLLRFLELIPVTAAAITV